MAFLPPNQGHFEVGCTDFMTPKNVDLKADGLNEKGSQEIPGFFMKLFYPTGKEVANNYQRAKWIPKGIYADGFINFMHLPVFLFGRLGKWLMGERKYLIA